MSDLDKLLNQADRILNIGLKVSRERRARRNEKRAEERLDMARENHEQKKRKYFGREV